MIPRSLKISITAFLMTLLVSGMKYLLKPVVLSLQSVLEKTSHSRTLPSSFFLGSLPSLVIPSSQHSMLAVSYILTENIELFWVCLWFDAFCVLVVSIRFNNSRFVCG